MPLASSGIDSANLEVNDTEDKSKIAWAPVFSSSPSFQMTSPFTSDDSFSAVNTHFQVKNHLNELDNNRMWRPPNDQILSGSTDSDISGNYRDVNQPCVNNTNTFSDLAASRSKIIVTGTTNGSPLVIDKKWMPQSPETSRFFRDVSCHSEVPSHFTGLDCLDKHIPSDASPNAIAVFHGSPLDLSFPVKDCRGDSHESTGSANIGLGIAQGQRRGSLGENSSVAYITAPIGSPSLRSTICNSAKSCFDVLTQERQIFEPVIEINGFAPFPSLSSATNPGSSFRGVNDQQEHYSHIHVAGCALHSGEGFPRLSQGSNYLKSSTQILDAHDQSQLLQKTNYNQGPPIQNQDFSSSQGHGVHQPQCDSFSMDSMQESLRTAALTSPYCQQQPHYTQQQMLPPRSPQLNPPTATYFSPGRGGRANSNSPITATAFTQLVSANDYHSQLIQGQQSGHSTMPSSPFIGSSRGQSPVNNEYSFNSGGNTNYLLNGHSHSPQISTDRHAQRQSPQHHQDSHTQFSSIDQQPYSNDGCIYQVQFKRSHRCLILSSSAPHGIKPGDFVIVEADRGEDLGVVVSMAPRDSSLAATIFAACSSSMRGPDSEFLKKILRIASMQERMDLPTKAQEELDLLEVCRDRAREMYSLPMSLVDAEFQFDRHKLILYYSASRRIDFREFVRDLFAIYKTRIWMEQATSHHSFRPSETAARALATGVLHQHHSPLTLPPSASSVVLGSPVGRSHFGVGNKIGLMPGDIPQRNYPPVPFFSQNAGQGYDDSQYGHQASPINNQRQGNQTYH